jgi:long-chain fatty acid transport protein
MKRRLLYLVALLLALSARAPADGVVRDGLGPISTGRGGTNLGFADNGAVIYDNPAGMVNVAGNGLADIAFDTVITDLHFTNPGNDSHSRVKPLPLPELAIMKKSADGIWAYGVGVFAPAGFGAQFNMQNPITGPATYESFGALAKILPGLSCRVTERLSIGATLGVGISEVRFQGPYFFQTGPLAGTPTLFNTKGTGAAPVGSAGLQYQLDDDTVLAFTYVSESRFNLAGKTGVDVFGPFPGSPLASEFNSNLHLVWPRSFGWGVRHNLSPQHRVAADLIWYNWASAFNQIDITLTNPNNPIVAGLVGPTVRDTFPLRWHDTVSIRTGYEWLPTWNDTFRLGYVYHRSPVPSSTLNPFLDGVLEHAFSAGYSRRMGRASLNVAYQYSFGHTRHVQTSDIVGGDFNNSTLRAQAHWLSGGITVPF